MYSKYIDRPDETWAEGTLFGDLKATLAKHNIHLATVALDSGYFTPSPVEMGGRTIGYISSFGPPKVALSLEGFLVTPKEEPEPPKAIPYYRQRRKFSGPDYYNYKWKRPTWDDFDGGW